MEDAEFKCEGCTSCGSKCVSDKNREKSCSLNAYTKRVSCFRSFANGSDVEPEGGLFNDEPGDGYEDEGDVDEKAVLKKHFSNDWNVAE